MKKTSLAYEKMDDGAKFREQYRFLFSTAIIATVFVAPNGNALELFIKLTLGFSAFFAALYLIASAARVKYREPGRMYEVFYINERFRMWTYDWSVNTFAAAFLYFIGLLTTGFIEKLPHISLGPLLSFALPFIFMFATALLIVFMSHILNTKIPRNEKRRTKFRI